MLTLLLLLAQGAESETRRTLAPGIEYGERSWTRNGDGPFAMQWLELDPSHSAVNVVPMRAESRAVGREQPTAMARRWGATAVVNAGYFVTAGPYLGGSTGAYLWGGEPVSSGAGRTALLLCEEEGDRERWEFDVADFRGWARTSSAAQASISGLNRIRSASNDLVLYTPRLGPKTLTATEGAEAVLDAGGVVLRLEDGTGNAGIPANGTVLSGSGEGAAWLRTNARPGSVLSVASGFETRGGCKATDIIGAGPKLVSNGKPDVREEGFAHAKSRHPRTAAAVTGAGKLLLVTLDGRQSHSVGMRLDEFAETLIGLGAVEAMNLDGGGSTVMAAQGQIRNAPSDGSERPVGDALLVYSVSNGAQLAALVRNMSSEAGWPDAAAATDLEALARQGDRDEFLRLLGRLEASPGPAKALLAEAARGALRVAGTR